MDRLPVSSGWCPYRDGCPFPRCTPSQSSAGTDRSGQIWKTLQRVHKIHSLTHALCSIWPEWDVHGGGLPCSIVSQERGDLSFVKLQVEVVHGQFSSLFVDFDQVSDAYTEDQVTGLWLYVIWSETNVRGLGVSVNTAEHILKISKFCFLCRYLVRRYILLL